MKSVRPQIYETTPVAEIISQLRREVMPVPFIRRMRVINVLSAVTLRKIEDSMLLPFDVMDIHHVLDKQISQDAIIAILENDSLAIAIDSGDLQPLWEESANLSLLRKGFEQGWIQRFILLPFDPICIMLAMRAKLLLDAVDELGHSYNLIRAIGCGWIDFGDIEGEDPGDPDSYIPPGIDQPIDYPEIYPPPGPGDPGYVPGPGDPGYVPPADLTPGDPGYTTEPGSPGYVPPADLTPGDPGYTTTPGSPGYTPTGREMPGEPGYVAPVEAVPMEIPAEIPAEIEAPAEIPVRVGAMPDSMAPPLYVGLWPSPPKSTTSAPVINYYFYETFFDFTTNPWSKYTTGAASVAVVGHKLILDNAYLGTTCRTWCNLTTPSPAAWTANIKVKVTRPTGDANLQVLFYMDNGYVDLRFWNNGKLYMLDAQGNTNTIEDIVPVGESIRWQVFSEGGWYWVFKQGFQIAGPISIRGQSGRQIKLEQTSEGYSEVDEVIISY